MECNKCGAQIQDDGKFCQVCGSPAIITQTAPQTQPQPAPQIQPQSPPQAQAQVSAHSQLSDSEQKNMKFIFVTSMVFMIFFAIRLISAISSLSDWDDLKNTSGVPSDVMETINKITSSVQIGVVVTVLTFAAILTFFMRTSTLRKPQTPKASPESRSKAYKILFTLSIIVVIFGILYLGSEILLMTDANQFFDMAANYIDKTTLTQLKSEMQTQFFGSLAFDVIFIIFGIISITKCRQLAKSTVDNIS